MEAPKPFGIDSITSEQEQRIQDIQATLQTQMLDKRPSAETVEKESAQWETIIQAEKFDKNKVQEILQAYNETQMDVQIMKIKAEHDIYQVLTPEQKNTLAQRQQEQKEQMKMMMEEAKSKMNTAE